MGLPKPNIILYQRRELFSNTPIYFVASAVEDSGLSDPWTEGQDTIIELAKSVVNSDKLPENYVVGTLLGKINPKGEPSYEPVDLTNQDAFVQNIESIINPPKEEISFSF